MIKNNFKKIEKHIEGDSLNQDHQPGQNVEATMGTVPRMQAKNTMKRRMRQNQLAPPHQTLNQRVGTASI